jgi:hypothetical protein
MTTPKEQTMLTTHARQIYFAYCVHQLADKSWVVLNRNHKLLGSDSAEYESVPAPFRIAKITGTQAQKISYLGENDAEGKIYLYNDGCIPSDSEKDMAAYLKRLSVLMNLELKGEPK